MSEVKIDKFGFREYDARWIYNKDINKFGITPDVEVKMNINPILQNEIGTRRDKQYKAGEKELIKMIQRNYNISQFDPKSSNLNAFLVINKKVSIYSLN